MFHNHTKKTNNMIHNNYTHKKEDIENFLRKCSDHEIKDMREYIEKTLKRQCETTFTNTSHDLMDLLADVFPEQAGVTLLNIANGTFDFAPYNLQVNQITDLKVKGDKYKGARDEYVLLNDFLRNVNREYNDRQEQQSGCSFARCSQNC